MPSSASSPSAAAPPSALSLRGERTGRLLAGGWGRHDVEGAGGAERRARLVGVAGGSAHQHAQITLGYAWIVRRGAKVGQARLEERAQEGEDEGAQHGALVEDVDHRRDRQNRLAAGDQRERELRRDREQQAHGEAARRADEREDVQAVADRLLDRKSVG